MKQTEYFSACLYMDVELISSKFPGRKDALMMLKVGCYLKHMVSSPELIYWRQPSSSSLIHTLNLTQKEVICSAAKIQEPNMSSFS